MMAVGESDLELLEQYLDDALDEREREALRARLAVEQDLVTALDQLRGERAMRHAFFGALEPNSDEVERLMHRVHGAIERRRRAAGLLRGSRYVVAAAACFVFGFLVHAAFFAGAGGQNGELARPVANPGAVLRAVETYEVTLRDGSGKVIAVQRFDDAARAREFADDLAAWQHRAQRRASGQFVVRSQRL